MTAGASRHLSGGGCGTLGRDHHHDRDQHDRTPDELHRREPLPRHHHAEHDGDHRVDVGVGRDGRDGQGGQRVGVGAERPERDEQRHVQPGPPRHGCDRRRVQPLADDRPGGDEDRSADQLLDRGEGEGVRGHGHARGREGARRPARPGEQHERRPPPGAAGDAAGALRTARPARATPGPPRRRARPARSPGAGGRRSAPAARRCRAAPRRSGAPSARRRPGSAPRSPARCPMPAAAARTVPPCRVGPGSSRTPAARRTAAPGSRAARRPS